MFFRLLIGLQRSLIAIALGRLGMTVDECIEMYCSLMREIFPEKPNSWLTRPWGSSQSSQNAASAATRSLEEKLKDIIVQKLGHGQQDASFEVEDGRCRV